MLNLTSSLPHFFPHPSIPPKKPIILSNLSPFSTLFGQIRARYSVSASNNRKKNSNSTEIDDLYDDNDEVEEEEEAEEEEGEIIPLSQMRRWFDSRPKGFGEGKDYDTLIEERLLEEIEQSRTAQLANINKLKSSLGQPTSKKQQKVPNGIEVLPSGIQVRVDNLPKKKNIQRDLQLAFKEFTGIVNISPAVSGNKKTRDPVCKGFAFIYLESEMAAHRFVETFYKKSIKFGKIEKQITCEIKNPRHSPNAHSEQSAYERDTDSDIDDIIHNSEEETLYKDCEGVVVHSGSEMSTRLIDVPFDESTSSEQGEIEAGTENISISNGNEAGIENISVSNGNEEESWMSKKEGAASKDTTKETHAIEKKQRVKRIQKGLKLNVPTSARRLKIKERAVLTGVFSKYGAKPASASLENK